MSNLKNPLIYLVDDDPAFRRMIDAYLKQNRLTRIKQFDSGEEMLELLSKEKPELVIQDFQLGENKLNGLEILKKAKAIHPKVDFIFLSGQDNINIAVDIIKGGAFDYVVKDGSAKEALLNRIKKYIFQVKLIHHNNLYKIGGFAILGILFFIILTCYLAGVKLIWYE